MSVIYHEAKEAHWKWGCSCCGRSADTHESIPPSGWVELLTTDQVSSHLCQACIDRFTGHWDVAGQAVVTWKLSLTSR
jgi:hypothetical protein